MMLITYANSAYCSLRLDSMQFNNVPTRKFRIKRSKNKNTFGLAQLQVDRGHQQLNLQTGRLYILMAIYLMESWVLLFGVHALAMVLLDLT